jgi:molecular chaperone GrpE (heat shock protein)
MQRGIFTAYNEVIRSKKIFEQKIEKTSTDFDSSFYTALFDELLSTIKRYLMDNFDIQPLSVNRGDKFDIEKHNLLTQPEPDSLLENNTIKEVANYGFQQNGIILVLSDIILVKN